MMGASIVGVVYVPGAVQEKLEPMMDRRHGTTTAS